MAALIALYNNRYTTKLAAPLSAVATTATISAGTGAAIPAIPSGYMFPLTLTDAATGLVVEQVQVTAVAGDVITIIRGREGTTAVAWLVGDNAFNAATAGYLNSLIQTPAAQQGQLNYALDTGASGASYVINPLPQITSLLDGFRVFFKAAHTSAASPTLTVGTTAATPLVGNDLSTPSVAGQIIAVNGYVEAIYAASINKFIVVNCAGGPLNIAAATSQTQAVTFGQVQSLGGGFATDTGTANAYVFTQAIAPTAYVDGARYNMIATNANTGASTINMAGLGAKALVGSDTLALKAGSITAGCFCILQYVQSIDKVVLLLAFGGRVQTTDGTQSSHVATVGQIQRGAANYVVAAGTANAITATLAPAITAYTDGITVNFRAANANTGAATLSVNGLTATNIIQENGQALAAGMISANSMCSAVYSSNYAAFILQNSSQSAINSPSFAGYSGAQITAVASSGSLVVTLLAGCTINFRSATQTSGAIVPVYIPSNLTITVPSGATLGMQSGSGRTSNISVLVAYNAGSPILCVMNSLTGVAEINTQTVTAVSGSSNSNNSIYGSSSAANTPVAVVGAIAVTQTTAGTFDSPTSVSSAGFGASNLAVVGMAGANPNTVTGSRAVNTWYYNTTGAPIIVQIEMSAAAANTTFSVFLSTGNTTSGYVAVASRITVAAGMTFYPTFPVMPGGAYYIQVTAGTMSLNTITEYT